MEDSAIHIHQQLSAYDSPWSKGQRIKMLLWEYVWRLLCSWTPKPANNWRLFWLKAFGAQVFGKPFVHQRARIQIPWNLTLHDRAALGDRANAYSLGKIEVHAHATVAQEAYLNTGTHAFEQPAKNLVTAPIIIRTHAFIGARAFIMPGITIGEYAIVGACSVVTKSVLPRTTVMGNPARTKRL
ncbi:LbetaH domain-containing protein [Pontibacter ramchanderi]|uniref:Putative colanic acid biosynthesis acetyltransferase WcaF n=1 Tax=Pontibacter ramchanderi TaxID=1179743 RepID=A0A2N3V1N6_9BACT|nr:putative colanic acid biosynthesis acetyltransferase [Pontibacter ramchanderi]PKV75534.1 putative colanic acid biosynthesis acetyltransferase WcaF [Pontibacter ramchanderi]